MKTTEKVNLAGYAFTLDKDAYAELEGYLSEIRVSLGDDLNADEIISDIEERIAELLAEKCTEGIVACRNTIKDIRRRIGKPEEFTDVDGRQSPAKSPCKRLYRDTENRCIGGVCSGLGAYFNTDKVFIRLIFLVLFFAGFIGIDEGPFCLVAVAAYICLWIAMPAARTVEDRCRMKGKPMRLDNFRANSTSYGIRKEAKEVRKSPAFEVTGRIVSSITGIILAAGGFGGLMSLIFINKVPDIINLHIGRYTPIWALPDPGATLVTGIVTDPVLWWMIIAITGIFSIWMLYNGIRLAFGLAAPSWKPGFVLFILWIVCILALAAWIMIQISEALPLLMA